MNERADKLSSSTNRGISIGSANSTDWTDQFDVLRLLDSQDFDDKFFEVFPPSSSRRSSTKSNTRGKFGRRISSPFSSPDDGFFLPEMPPLAGAERSESKPSTSSSRDISTESAFDPQILAEIEKDVQQRMSTADYLEHHILLKPGSPSTVTTASETTATSTTESNGTSDHEKCGLDKCKRKRDTDIHDTHVGVADETETPASNKKNKHHGCVEEGTTRRQLREYDVVMGRGGKSNNHRGNILYRSYVRDMTPIHDLSTKQEKTKITWQIVQQVYDLGGRFIEEDKSTGLWHVIDAAQARRKTSQKFRDEKNPKK